MEKNQLIETESRLVVGRGDVGQKAQTSSYEINKSWECNA